MGPRWTGLELETTDDCTLIITMENSATVKRNREVFDPPGGVAIIRFPAGVENRAEVKILNFTEFNNQ